MTLQESISCSHCISSQRFWQYLQKLRVVFICTHVILHLLSDGRRGSNVCLSGLLFCAGAKAIGADSANPLPRESWTGTYSVSNRRRPAADRKIINRRRRGNISLCGHYHDIHSLGAQ